MVKRAGLVALILTAITIPGAAFAETLKKDDASLSPFGIGSSSINTRSLEKWIPQMSEIGIKILRDPGSTGWSGTDRTSWESLDKKLDFLASQKMRTGGFFYNYSKPGGFPLNDLEGWTNDVKAIVGHTKGRIKYWELWNEPPNGTHNVPPADYAKYVIATYDAAKAANPECLIGLAAQSAHINYLDQTIKAGAKGHFDYITLHPYETVDVLMSRPGTEALYLNIVPAVRKMLAARDPAKANVPVVFTEIGHDSKKGADRQAQALIKVYSMGIAQGVACIQWFEGIDGDSGPMGLLQGNGTPRPAYTAMAQLIKLLGQHPAYLGWVLLNDKDSGFVFQGAKDTVMALWAPKGTTDKVDFGQPVSVVDPLTGAQTKAATYQLTESPVLVEGVPDALLKQAKANKLKPFPWGGDFTNAKSVSVTMGEKNVETGLHTHSGDSIAAAVVAYGGSARVGSVPGGNVFMVDPNFLTYTSVPIEITAVVRRNEANDPAQLVLEYESTGGYKKAPVYEIPDNTKWHAASWKIDDAQFVAKWGFNFRFNSGKYVIQSVTVTKLQK